MTAPLPAVADAVPPPGPRLLGTGDQGPKVRDLQARLRQIAWYFGNVGDTWDTQTTAAVKGFQEKRGSRETGYVDQRTLSRLREMTRTPTRDELANRLPGDLHTDAKLDARCLTGHAMCVDKTEQHHPLGGRRQGRCGRWRCASGRRTPRPARASSTWAGSRATTSPSSTTPRCRSRCSSPGGQAVHYSSDFAARGYAGASHGCVNVRDHAGVQWLFDQVNIGDKVVIYWS